MCHAHVTFDVVGRATMKARIAVFHLNRVLMHCARAYAFIL